MAGKGTRTLQLGEFKPFIKINDITSFQWFIKSIKNNIKPEDKIICVTTKYFDDKFDVEKNIKLIAQEEKLQNDITVILAQDTPKGPSASVYLSRTYIDNNPTIVANCDQFVTFVLPTIKDEKTGFLPVNCNFGSSKSYVKLDKNNSIVNIKEKENISNIASSGIYIVSNGTDLMKALERQFNENKMHKNEFYVGPSLNYLINEKDYIFSPLDVQAKYDLGNVEEIKLFEKIINNIIYT
jgi:dTDP-glucose pyrophosphorylase